MASRTEEEKRLELHVHRITEAAERSRYEYKTQTVPGPCLDCYYCDEDRTAYPCCKCTVTPSKFMRREAR